MKNKILQPIVIEIENKTENEIEHVTLFGASNVFNNLYNKKTNLIDGLEIKSSVPNVDYSDVILKTINKPFEVESVYFKLSNKPDDFIFQIKRKDVNGNVAQSNVKTNSVLEKEDALIKSADFYVERNFTIDFFTELVISKILSKTKITIYINVL